MGSGRGRQRRAQAQQLKHVELEGLLSAQANDEATLMLDPELVDSAISLFETLEKEGLLGVQVELGVREIRRGAPSVRSSQPSRFNIRGVIRRNERGVCYLQGARLSKYFDPFWDKKVMVSVAQLSETPPGRVPVERVGF